MTWTVNKSVTLQRQTLLHQVNIQRPTVWNLMSELNTHTCCSSLCPWVSCVWVPVSTLVSGFSMILLELWSTPSFLFCADFTAREASWNLSADVKVQYYLKNINTFLIRMYVWHWSQNQCKLYFTSLGTLFTVNFVTNGIISYTNVHYGLLLDWISTIDYHVCYWVPKGSKE